MNRPITLALAGIALIAAGCGGGGGNDDETSPNRTNPPFIALSDVEYIDAIVPHHEMALHMAEMEVAKGTRADVKALATRIRDAQTAEIAMLEEARRQLTGQAEVPPPPADPHMERDMNLMMSATGAEVDQMFLDDMIPHHAEGISIAHRALPNLDRTDVRQNAENVVSNQAAEIGEMEGMRD
ncbi:MAG: DUF305 domain-containing protein [Fimbriimonas sp.]